LAVEPLLGSASTLEATAYARTLYERHARTIYAHCLSRLRDREDAEDALQATYLNALRGVRRGVVPELELAWLFAIANRVVSNRRRADARRRRVETPHDLDELQDVLAAPVAGAVDLVRLRDSLASMPEQQCRAFLLREWQGLSCREIATELGLTTGAVEQLLFRARRTLQHELTKPESPLRRLRSLGLGTLLLRLKTLLGLGAAAKVVAVATTVVVATVGVMRHEHVAVASLHTSPPVREQRPAPAAFTAPVRAGAHAVSVSLVSPPAPDPAPIHSTAQPAADDPAAPVVVDAPADPPSPPASAEAPAPAAAGATDVAPALTTIGDPPAADDAPVLRVPLAVGPPADVPEQAAAVTAAQAPDTPAATGELPPQAAAAIAVHASETPAATGQLPPQGAAATAAQASDTPAATGDLAAQAAAAQAKAAEPTLSPRDPPTDPPGAAVAAAAGPHGAPAGVAPDAADAHGHSAAPDPAPAAQAPTPEATDKSKGKSKTP
jgi:RNA polymerase sigma factor (sigma-70 family)